MGMKKKLSLGVASAALGLALVGGAHGPHLMM